MTLNAVFVPLNTNPCLLYLLNNLRTTIGIEYVDETLEIGDKPALVGKHLYIKI